MVAVKHLLPEKAPVLPVLLLALWSGLAIFGYLRYSADVERQLDDIRVAQEIEISILRNDISHAFDMIKDDALILASHAALTRALAQTDSAELASGAVNELLDEYKRFMLVRSSYDQLRLIDRTGMERLRINNVGGVPTEVPEGDLQNKVDRYYFYESINLPPRQLYVSEMDLNIENGEIERPLKPMIRFSLPVDREDGSRWGVLVLNFNATQLLESLATQSQGVHPNHTLLADPAGHWLLALNPEETWGSYLAERSAFSIDRQFPAVASQLQTESMSHVLDDAGFFTTMRVDPYELELELDGYQLIPGEKWKEGGYVWQLMLWTPPSVLESIRLDAARKVGLEELIVAIPLTLLAFFYSRNRSRRLAVEREINHLAQFDVLTELPNRALILDRLAVAMRQAKRNRTNIAVLFVDLDGFKKVNDELGHLAGDQLLRDVAQRLLKACRSSDSIGRLGGDEFLIVLNGPLEVGAVYWLAEKILRVVAKPVKTEAGMAGVTASIGAVLYAGEEISADKVIAIADEAMYRAKEAGKNQYRLTQLVPGELGTRNLMDSGVEA